MYNTPITSSRSMGPILYTGLPIHHPLCHILIVVFPLGILNESIRRAAGPWTWALGRDRMGGSDLSTRNSSRGSRTSTRNGGRDGRESAVGVGRESSDLLLVLGRSQSDWSTLGVHRGLMSGDACVAGLTAVRTDWAGIRMGTRPREGTAMCSAGGVIYDGTVVRTTQFACISD